MLVVQDISFLVGSQDASAIGRFEIIGLGKTQSYQWFVSSQQAVFLIKNKFDSNTPSKGDYGWCFHIITYQIWGKFPDRLSREFGLFILQEECLNSNGRRKAFHGHGAGPCPEGSAHFLRRRPNKPLNSRALCLRNNSSQLLRGNVCIMCGPC